jgi:hypothetical protein
MINGIKPAPPRPAPQPARESARETMLHRGIAAAA